MNAIAVDALDCSGGKATKYINPGHTCRVVGGYSCASGEAGSDGAKTITISDGTTDVGVINIAATAAVGTVDKMTLDSTSKGAVKFDVDTPIKIVGAGTGAGLFAVTLMLDAYHSDC